jgi:hypothetical protein
MKETVTIRGKPVREIYEKMDDEIREQIRFVLDDDDEGMWAGLEEDSDLDDDNKQMNRELIKKHEQILAKLGRGEPMSQQDLQLIRDANEIHVNDSENLNGCHEEALALEEWLDGMITGSKDKTMDDVVFRWELTRQEFIRAIADSHPEIEDREGFFDKHKEYIIQRFGNGFAFLVSERGVDYGIAVNDAIDEAVGQEPETA